MRRRDFIAGLGGAIAWPLSAYSQPDARIRRIGILARGTETERVVQTQLNVLREGLAKLGWIEGRNAQFDRRFTADDPDRLRAHADELVRLAPDVIAVESLPATQALLQRTRTIPIVFAHVGDPVAGGLLQNIGRPEGNVTGATSLFQSIGGKWLELLKEAAPRTTRVALIFATENANGIYFEVMDGAAEVLGLKVTRMSYRGAAALERAINTFAEEPNGGLVLVPPPPAQDVRELIIRLAMKHRLPTVFISRQFVADGFMLGYGSDIIEPYRVVPSYIDRILRGTKISELPVQFPTKFDLAVNLKTARAIGLTIPESLLLRADEVIE